MQPAASNTKATPKKKTGGWKPPKGDSCAVCSKAVYYMERVAADDKVYHKTCFKCSECNKTLSTGTYAALDGKVFCKPHFKQLFKRKGRYTFAQGGSSDAAPSSVIVPANINLTGTATADTKPTPAKQQAQPKQAAAGPSSARSRGSATSVHQRFAAKAEASSSSSSSSAVSMFLPSSRFGMCTTPLTRGRGSSNSLVKGSSKEHDATTSSDSASNSSGGARAASGRASSSNSSRSSRAASRKPSASVCVVKGSSTPDVACPKRTRNVRDIRALFESSAASKAPTQASKPAAPSTRPALTRVGSNTSARRAFFERASRNASASQLTPQATQGPKQQGTKGAETAKQQVTKESEGEMKTKKAKQTSEQQQQAQERDTDKAEETAARQPADALPVETRRTPSTPVSRGGSSTRLVSARKAQMEQLRRTTMVVKGSTADDFRRTQQANSARGNSGKEASVKSAVQLFESLNKAPGVASTASSLRPRAVFGLQQAGESTVDTASALKRNRCIGHTGPTPPSAAAESNEQQQQEQQQGGDVRSVVLLGDSGLGEASSTDMDVDLQQKQLQGDKEEDREPQLMKQAPQAMDTRREHEPEEEEEEQQQQVEEEVEEKQPQLQGLREDSMMRKGQGSGAVACAFRRMSQGSRSESEADVDSEAENAPVRHDERESDDKEAGTAVLKPLANDAAVECKPMMTRRLSSVLHFSTFVNVNWDDTTIVA